MRRSSNATGRRRGGIAPLTAILLIPLTGMVAFAVDLGYAKAVRSDLQNVADAAALAGAGKLQQLFVQTTPRVRPRRAISPAVRSAAAPAARGKPPSRWRP